MRFIPLFIVVLLMVGCGGPAKLCLVSPLSGTIITKGAPVEGAKVTLKYSYKKEIVETVAYTDAKGYFQFEGVWKKVMVQIAHQPVIEQKVVVEHSGNSHTVLDVTKMDYDGFGEMWEVQYQDPKHGKDRLIKKDGRLYFTFDLGFEKVPIGRKPQ